MTNKDVATRRFRSACKGLAEEVNKQLFEGSRKWYWVADFVGGSCDFGDTDFLTPEDMVVILESGMTYDKYVEWRDANIKYGETKGFINLRSWLMGCRHDLMKPKKKEDDGKRMFEYKTIKVPSEKDPIMVLNEEGEQGWELLLAKWEFNPCFWLKREITGTNKREEDEP